MKLVFGIHQFVINFSGELISSSSVSKEAWSLRETLVHICDFISYSISPPLNWNAPLTDSTCT
jgi:hypothetical protein